MFFLGYSSTKPPTKKKKPIFWGLGFFLKFMWWNLTLDCSCIESWVICGVIVWTEGPAEINGVIIYSKWLCYCRNSHSCLSYHMITSNMEWYNKKFLTRWQYVTANLLECPDSRMVTQISLCGDLKQNSLYRPIGSDTIRKFGPIGVGVALLDEVCHWRLFLRKLKSFSVSPSLPATSRSRCRTLCYIVSTLSAFKLPCFSPL